MKINFINSIIYGIILSVCILFSCKKENNSTKISHTEGNIEISVEPAFKNMSEALVMSYSVQYPKTNIKLIFYVENKIIDDFLRNKAKTIIIGKPLTEVQKEYISNYTEVQIACDAVIFISSKNSKTDSISLSYIKEKAFSEKSNFIFDNSNSSSYNLLIERLNITNNKSIVSLESNEEVIEYVSKHENFIGIIGYNVISNQSSPEILDKIKVLSVIDNNNEIIPPSIQNIRTSKYPFSRRIFILNNDPKYSIGSGLATFAISQIGQLIIEKEGLQPYVLFPKEVIIK